MPRLFEPSLMNRITYKKFIAQRNLIHIASHLSDIVISSRKIKYKIYIVSLVVTEFVVLIGRRAWKNTLMASRKGSRIGRCDVMLCVVVLVRVENAGRVGRGLGVRVARLGLFRGLPAGTSSMWSNSMLILFSHSASGKLCKNISFTFLVFKLSWKSSRENKGRKLILTKFWIAYHE